VGHARRDLGDEPDRRAGGSGLAALLLTTEDELSERQQHTRGPQGQKYRGCLPPGPVGGARLRHELGFLGVGRFSVGGASDLDVVAGGGRSGTAAAITTAPVTRTVTAVLTGWLVGRREQITPAG
jgi:hypothetical protein